MPSILDIELIKGFSAMGIGGVVCWLVLTWKRQDDRSNLEREKANSDRLASLADRALATAESCATAVKSNTDALREMGTMLKILEKLEGLKPHGNG